MNLPKRPFASRRGSVFIELALCATVLVLLFTGTLQFGYSFYLYNSLINGVRGGARYASLAKISNPGNGILPSSYITAVKNTVVFGSPTAAIGSTPIIPGLTTSNVDVVVDFDSSFVPKMVTIRINSFTIDAIVKSFVITNKPSLQIPFLGQYCPVSC